MSTFVFRVFSDIKSTSGQIHFKLNDSPTSTLTLNEVGLGVHTNPSANLSVNGYATITQKLHIGTSTSQDNLFIGGTLGYGTQTLTDNVLNGQLNHAFNLIDTSEGDIQINLPFPGNVQGQIFSFKQISSENETWIYAGNTTYIDNERTYVLNNEASFLKMLSDGTQWYLLDAPETEAPLISDNLVYWFKLDESSGNQISNDGSSGVSGNLANGITFESQSIDAIHEQGLDFDGNGYGALDSDQNLPMGNNPRSISVWLKVASYASQNIFSWGTNSSTKRSEFGLRGGGNRVMYAVNGGAYGTSTAPNTGEWFHCVMVFEGTMVSEVKFYINGESQTISKLAGADKAVNTTSNGFSQIAINTTRSGGEYTGDMDDLRVYDRALSLEEIQILYQSTPKP